MCGIAGLINDKNINVSYLKNMVHQLGSRGPNYRDIWIDQNRNFSFVHTRLSILDLTNNGNQPMRSSSGNLLITFNGEIYNHMQIRNKINNNKKISWKSSCDTETVLEAIDMWGLQETLKILDGMFAFCVYDYKQDCFYLAKDKFGEKPIYYGWNNEVFIFGSDLNILKNYPFFDKAIDYLALNYFLKLSYVPSPFTIFKNMKKLPPGSFLKISNNSFKTELYNYWSVEKNFDNKIVNNKKNEADYINECHAILKKSVISRTLSDVPIGTFLSGGIDSALITSIITSNTKKKLNTFTLGYEGDFQDETLQARLIANELKTDHNEIKVNFNNILETINEISNTFSEPFADSSQIPTMLISKQAKKQVSVILTGDGADELFGGYNRYRWIDKIDSLSLINKTIFKKFLNLIPKKIFSKFFSNDYVLKLDKLKNIINFDDIEQMYLSTIFHDYDETLMPTETENNIFNLKKNDVSKMNLIEKMMMMDTKYYLSDDILCKVDRSSMKYSLETRAPYLNEELLNFAINLPYEYKVRKKINKYLLRQVLNIYIPKKFIDNQKKGFSIPIGYWMRNKLKNWCESILFSKNSFASINLNSLIIKKIWQEHQSKSHDRSKILWNLIILNLWAKEWNI